MLPVAEDGQTKEQAVPPKDKDTSKLYSLKLPAVFPHLNFDLAHIKHSALFDLMNYSIRFSHV